MKRALVIRHVAHEGIAGYRAPLEAAGYVIDGAAACEPCLAKVDPLAPELLIVMGGPMGVYERDTHPWIDREIALIRRRIAAGLPTLGVCLGAQLIAAALGARVWKGPALEIGFAPVTLTDAGRTSPLAALEGVPMLHWHGDTFDVPAGARLLARTASYDQAFAVGDHVLALQFHAEMGEDARFEHWLENDREQIAEAGLDAATLRADHLRHGPAAVAAGQAMLGGWLDRLERREARAA